MICPPKSRLFGVTKLTSIIVFVSFLSACGQKGPLYLPDEKPQKTSESQSKKKPQKTSTEDSTIKTS